jgi:PAS domain S-box-containing protein
VAKGRREGKPQWACPGLYSRDPSAVPALLANGLTAAPSLGDDLMTILAGSTDGAFVEGENRRIIFWNRAATSITGYTATEALGRACCDLFAGHDDGTGSLPDPASVMTRVETTVRAFDVCTTTKAGHPLWLHLIVFPVQVRKGTALVVHLFCDVTPTRQLVTLVQERLAAPDKGRVGALPGHGPLTRRELEVLRLTAQGLRTVVIAELLHISRATVRNHVQNILWKLGVHNRLQAVAYSARHGLL